MSKELNPQTGIRDGDHLDVPRGQAAKGGDLPAEAEESTLAPAGLSMRGVPATTPPPVAAPDGGVSEEELERWATEDVSLSVLYSSLRDRQRLAREVKRLREERRWVLDVKTKEGLTASEWVLRTGRAEEEAASWRRVAERCKTEANAAEARLAEVERERDNWKNDFNMYRRAWIRELGGFVIPKAHDIDALVLTTREQHERAKRADKAEAVLAAEREHADRLAEALRGFDVPGRLMPDQEDSERLTGWQAEKLNLGTTIGHLRRARAALAAHDARRKGE